MNDEWLVEHPRLREFVAEARRIMAAEPDPARRVRALRQPFAALLADQGWLPEEMATPYAASGMGGGIGQYLLFRAGDGSLGVFSLVVPPGSATPVHDHLAWGLVGLYRGEQEEEVYRRLDHGGDEGPATLELVARQRLRAGECYDLLPPDGDIHRVRTTSADPSISIHVLGSDVGCSWRHAFDPEAGTVRRFRSGYSNRQCEAAAGG